MSMPKVLTLQSFAGGGVVVVQKIGYGRVGYSVRSRLRDDGVRNLWSGCTRLTWLCHVLIGGSAGTVPVPV